MPSTLDIVEEGMKRLEAWRERPSGDRADIIKKLREEVDEVFRPILYLPIGPPGAGKTTLCKHYVLTGTLSGDAVVSTDYFRKLLTGDSANQHENRSVFQMQDLVAEARLRNGLDVWIDATNLSKHGQWAELAAEYNAHVHIIVFDEEEGVYRSRNALRNNPVPADVMDKLIGDWLNVLDRLSDIYRLFDDRNVRLRTYRMSQWHIWQPKKGTNGFQI